MVKFSSTLCLLRSTNSVSVGGEGSIFSQMGETVSNVLLVLISVVTINDISEIQQFS